MYLTARNFDYEIRSKMTEHSNTLKFIDVNLSIFNAQNSNGFINASLRTCAKKQFTIAIMSTTSFNYYHKKCDQH